LGYPDVFLGSSPDRTPALYHLMSAMDLTGGVLYPQGGFGELMTVMERLARAAGARLHTGAEVTEIRTAAGGRRGTRAQATGVRFRDAEGLER
ncbi:FAD-dependent oxidoreductase, partial [Escherichia coli]|nr:FAD-dependent oxidoreductase [Escherichia coli]